MEFVSNGCFELTGYQTSELVFNNSISYNEIIFPDDRERVWKGVQQAIDTKKSFRLSYRIISANKKIKWVLEQGIGIYSPDGKLLALEGFISNITEQKEAEEEVRKLSRSVEQSPTIIMITDLNGHIEYINPQFIKTTGFTLEEVIGKTPRILKSGNTPKTTYNELWDSILAGKEWSGEFQNRKKNGELYWESANIFPLKDDQGVTTHFIGMKQDITERKKMEEELISAKNKAEESDKLKSAFLANMSHEIRTPMNAILGFSQLLDEPGLTIEERFHYINLIQNSGNDLMNLIDDIIDISKIEAGQMKIVKTRYSPDQVLHELDFSFKEFLKTKRNIINLSITFKNQNNPGGIILHSDVDRFKQVFKNLLNNAIKFTEKGHIEFGYQPVRLNNRKFLEFYVSDTGIGIPEDKYDLIFESFTQVRDSDTKLYGGTGLGLSITKKIVEILGGSIRVTSVVGKGSTFYFTLPLDA
jgi:PAS domain S-box-containing protein